MRFHDVPAAGKPQEDADKEKTLQSGDENERVPKSVKVEDEENIVARPAPQNE